MHRDTPGRIIILGAGPTGLGAAYRLLELGYTDFTILERGEQVGGLASSVVDSEGFTWDLGGHVQFSHYEYYDKVLDLAVEKWLYHERESWIWIKGRFVPYPFQYNIRHLDSSDQQRILDGLKELKGDRRPANFKEWISQTFGEALGEVFLYPYNFKVWGYPPEMLDVGWMGERVAVPEVTRIERNIAQGKDDVSWGPNSKFRFPLHGGTGAIWKGVANLIPKRFFRFDSFVDRIDALGRRVHTSNAEISYDTLISTTPLDLLCWRIEGIDAEAHRSAQKLVHSSVHIVGIGLEGVPPETLRTKCWMYFPEGHSPYYRVTVFSNYSPYNVPDSSRQWSLMCEVCETDLKPVDNPNLVKATIQALRKDQLIPDDSQIVSTWHRRLEHGYPTPFLGRNAVLAHLNEKLEALGIFSRGRFGGWRYEVSNQDHSFMQGVELAGRLIVGSEEGTLDSSAKF